jgi:dihydrofolate reductase
MGRRTFDTLKKPLPGRRNMVITRNRDWSHAGVETVATLAEAIALAGSETELFVAGGAEIYQMALPGADRMQLTVIHAEIAGDTRFPEFAAREWTLAEDEPHAADARHAFPFSFRRYERRLRAP